MIHDTAQGQTQYDLCAELRAQITAYATKLGAESDQVCYLEDQLAASQAREEKLRDALLEIANGKFPREGDEFTDDSMRLYAREALTIPTDTSALDARLAEERERCIRVMFESDDLFIAESSIRSMT